MDKPRFALLDASHGEPHTRRNFRRELDAALAEFDVTDGELPATFGFDGVVVTGSRASVYWDEPWIGALLEWVGDAVDRGIPTLGVCYGHQVLAEALGGRVEDMGEYEIGYRTVEHAGGDLFEGVSQEFTVFTTHSDHVVELPAEAELLAENDYGVHAFRAGHAWGVQFHPEYDAQTAESVTRGKEDQLPEAKLRAALDGITPEAYDAACEAKQLFENFVDYTRRTSVESSSVASD